jgi:hypothetical protein
VGDADADEERRQNTEDEKTRRREDENTPRGEDEEMNWPTTVSTGREMNARTKDAGPDSERNQQGFIKNG